MKSTIVELPDRCECCGAPLEGGATIHADACAFLALIRAHFPGYKQPESHMEE